MKIYYEVKSKNTEDKAYQVYTMARDDFKNRVKNFDEEVKMAETVEYRKGFKKKISSIIIGDSEKMKKKTMRKIGFDCGD